MLDSDDAQYLEEQVYAGSGSVSTVRRTRHTRKQRRPVLDDATYVKAKGKGNNKAQSRG